MAGVTGVEARLIKLLKTCTSEWWAKNSAILTLKCVRGEVSVNLKMKLGPFSDKPEAGRGYQNLQRTQIGPSQLRRRERRAADPVVKQKAAEYAATALASPPTAAAANPPAAAAQAATSAEQAAGTSVKEASSAGLAASAEQAAATTEQALAEKLFLLLLERFLLLDKLWLLHLLLPHLPPQNVCLHPNPPLTTFYLPIYLPLQPLPLLQPYLLLLPQLRNPPLPTNSVQ